MISKRLQVLVAFLCLYVSIHLGVNCVPMQFDSGLNNWFLDENIFKIEKASTEKTISGERDSSPVPFPNSNEDNNAKKLSLDQQPKKLDWKLAFLCFSAVLALCLSFRYILRLIPELCYIIQRPSHQNPSTAQLIADGYCEAQYNIFRFEDPPVSETLIQSLSPAPSHSNDTNVLTSQKVPLHSVSDEQGYEESYFEAPNGTETEHFQMNVWPPCETPPPPYSPSMNHKNLL